MYKSRVLKRIFGPRERRQWEAGGDFIMASFIICMLHQLLLE
jgi:hypothetical protein